MFVGEAPGREEDLKGEPFVGRSGQLLDRLVLEEVGLTRDRFYIANVLKSRPPGNRDPLPAEIEACRPWLEAQLDLIDPKVVVTLGNFASKLLLATKEGITKLRGRSYPYRNGVLIPTFHPAAVLRGGGEPMAKMRADLIRVKEALGLASGDGMIDAATKSADDTPRAGGGHRSARHRAATSCCSPASSAPARRASPRASAGRSA